MDSSSNRVERRAGQRFPYLLPVCLREISTGKEVLGFTQDVSSRGVFFITDKTLETGAEIEVTLNMPSEITLGQSMRVRCRGRVLRVTAADQKPGRTPVVNSLHTEPTPVGTKIGIALRLESYEYLTE